MDLSLYLVTDSELLSFAHSLESCVSLAIQNGCTMVQLREKTISTSKFISLALKIKAVCKLYNVPFLINDRVDVALSVDADGVHIGQEDISVFEARRLLGSHKIIGLTVENSEQARIAIASGVKIDYFGSAAVFATNTKKHADGFTPLGVDGVKDILRVIRDAGANIPLVAIGGIKPDNVIDVLSNSVVKDAGKETRTLSGVAVVSAIIARKDPDVAALELSDLVRGWFKSTGVTSISKHVSLRSPRQQALVHKIAQNLAHVRSSKPLVHSITNYVVMNDTANAVLAIGGSPIMAHAVEEVSDIISFCGSLVINVGTLSEHWIKAFSIAGKKANELKTPIILDPVGAGATPLRQNCCQDLVSSLHIDIIKGNQGEISFLAGPLADSTSAQSRGVDSSGILSNPAAVVRQLVSKTKETSSFGYGSVVAMSGVVDYVADRFGKDVVTSANGNEWLGTITGTGCDTATLVASLAAVSKQHSVSWTGPEDENDFDPYLVSAIGGLVCMGIVAELAVETGKVSGQMSFKTALFDAIYNLTPDLILRRAKVDFS
ncbi:hypothetical protein HK098_005331 [Nowakowskiella sp. JEL0407]|nr:hypothetical protein HK098_005331 [Nowakowskiella sp. JEL0407]